MDPTKLTILIVPGSFSEYGIYNPFLAQVRNQGFTAFAVKLPSTQKRFPVSYCTQKLFRSMRAKELRLTK